MRLNIRKTLAFVCVLAFFLSTSAFAQNASDKQWLECTELKFPALANFVVDQAELLDVSSRTILTQKLKNLEINFTDQLVVATVPSLQGTSIENFANRLFNYWQLGQKDRNNGVLLIVAPNEHKVRIEVGYGLENKLTNAIASKIIEESIIPKFRVSDFSGGSADGVDAIIQAL